jgi:maltose O-acetyltransferase
MKYLLSNQLPITDNSLKIVKLNRIKNIPFLKRYYIRKVKSLFINSENVQISSEFKCKYGNIIAKNVYLNDTFCLDYEVIKIGENTTFSFQNMILTSSHDYDDFNKVIVKPVTIGENVWITSRVIILPGVTIGDNSVIGVGSVVTRDIPSGVYAAGNPAKVIKEINRGDTKWWEV